MSCGACSSACPGVLVMRGRKPKPTHLKLLDGNPGKRPLNAGEPKPERRIPTCPAHLNPTAKAEWKRLARQMHVLGIVTTSTARYSPPTARPMAGGLKPNASSKRRR